MRGLLCFLSVIFFSFQIPTAGLNPGDRVPDFKLVGGNGEPLRADSLKGNVIVISFWASWSQPSRKNNAEIGFLQEKFRKVNIRKKKQVVFLNISMDTKKSLWQVAKVRDNLYWPHNLIELAGWESPLPEQFRIRRIPANFIVDANGIIMAKDLWGKGLDSLINSLSRQLP